MKLRINKTLLISAILLSVFFGGAALAATQSQPLNLNWPSSPLGTSLKDNPDLLTFVKYLYEWMISLGGLAAFIALIYAGFMYVTSAGNIGRMRDARERLTSTAIGLGLLFGAYIILNTINPQLTVLQLPDLLPSTNFKPLDLSLNLKDETKSCDKVITSDSNLEQKTIKPENGAVPIPNRLLKIKIYGSCKVSFYDNKENFTAKSLVYQMQTIVNKNDNTEPEWIYLTESAPQGIEIYGIKAEDYVESIQF